MESGAGNSKSPQLVGWGLSFLSKKAEGATLLPLASSYRLAGESANDGKPGF